MIANVISAALEAAPGLGLTRGQNLFVENATGDQFVLLSTPGLKPWAPELTEHAGADLQVLVKGWTFYPGCTMAENIKAVILALEGVYTYLTETYTVADVAWKNGPVPFKDPSGAQCFTMNFRVFYHLSLA